MKKLNKFLLATSVATAVFGSTAMADQSGGVYVGVKAGYSNIKYEADKTGSDNVFTPSIFAGYKFGCASALCGRVDLSYTYFGEFEDTIKVKVSETHYTKNYLDVNMKMKAHNFLVNGYLDYAPTTDFYIYGTAGVGFSNVKRDISFGRSYSESDSDTGTSAQVGLGAGYYLTNNLIADIGYKYTLIAVIDSDDNDEYSKDDDDIYAHTIYAGLTYKF